MSVAGQALVGFGMALLLRAKFKANGLLTTLILIPMMLSPVVVGQFWKLIFHPLYGIFNYLIGFWNPPRPRLAQNPRSHVRGDRGRVDVEPVRHAALPLRTQGDPRLHLCEAAAIDRASAWRQFRRITLPSVAPLLTLAVLFRTIEAFKAFDLVMGLTGGGPGNVTETVSVSPLPDGVPGPAPHR